MSIFCKKAVIWLQNDRLTGIWSYLQVIVKDVLVWTRIKRMGGWTKIMIICRRKFPDTVEAYRIRPPHINLNYYHFLNKETPWFSYSRPYNFQNPNPLRGEIFVESGCLKWRTHSVGEIFFNNSSLWVKKDKKQFVHLTIHKDNQIEK